MDRRQFLKLLATLGGTSLALPAIASLPQAHIGPAMTASPLPSDYRQHAGGTFPRIGVIAIGGAGCAVLRSLQPQLPHLNRTVAIDTSPFALYRTLAEQYIWIGNTTDKATDPNTARFQAKVAKAELRDAVSGLDVAFLIFGLGGAAGSGIAPVLAEIIRDKGILTVATPITPFGFEGIRRNQIARTGVGAIARRADVTVELPNELFAVGAGDAVLSVVLERAAATFRELYGGLAGLLGEPGLIGVDFSDCRTLLYDSRHLCAFGYGTASASESPQSAVKAALTAPLLSPERLNRAQSAIVSIRGKKHMLSADHLAMIEKYVASVAPDVRKLFGAVPDESATADLSVSILAV